MSDKPSAAGTVPHVKPPLAKKHARGRAHNARIKSDIPFAGQSFSGFAALYSSHEEAAVVSWPTFSSRIRTRTAVGETVTEELLKECLFTSVADYRRVHGQRRTKLTTTFVEISNLETWFSGQETSVSYRTFWWRINRLQHRGIDIDSGLLDLACRLDTRQWRDAYGGGRRIPQDIDDDSFPSFSAYLTSIGRLHDYRLIRSRLQKGWHLESALEPKRERGGGIIYRITQLSTGLLYFGLTSMPLKERWRMHKASSIDPEYPLHQAMAQAGFEDFEIMEIEDLASDVELAAREKELIAQHGTLWPDGLNGNAGGAIGGGRKRACSHLGLSFESVEARNAYFADLLGLEAHVVGRRIAAGEPLDRPQRRVTAKRLNNSEHQRQWLNLCRKAKRGEIELDPRWLDPHAWFEDLRPDLNTGLHLVRICDARAYAPGNVAWCSVQTKIEKTHGEAVTITGVRYPTLTAAANAHGIAVSTFKYRLKKGLSPDEAVFRPVGPTSQRHVPKKRSNSLL